MSDLKIRRECENNLMQMGFSRFEAAAYTYLLQHSPATGYKVAKGIGTSYSNAYKVLESLLQKGYILSEKGTHKKYRATPITRLLTILERNSQSVREKLVSAIRNLPPLPRDPHTYQLENVEQVYSFAERMLEECQERALLEIFPRPLARLRKSIEGASARGCRIAVRIYRKTRIKGVKTILSPYGDENIRAWKSHWLSIYIDGRQYLQAILANGGKHVLQSVWSENPLLSQIFFGYLNSDLHHYAFQSTLKSSSSLKAIRASYNRLQKEFPVGKDPGYRALIADPGKTSMSAKG